MAQKGVSDEFYDENEVTVEENAKKPKRSRNRPDLQKFGYEYAEPGDNARFIHFAMTLSNKEKVDFYKPDEVKARTDEYFNLCAENDIRPSIVGLSKSLGVSRQTLWNYKVGATISIPKETVDIIKNAYDMTEMLWEMYMMTTKGNPANLIFMGKNFYGYKDAQELVVSAREGDNTADPEEIARKYIQGAAADIPEDIEGDGTVD